MPYVISAAILLGLWAPAAALGAMAQAPVGTHDWIVDVLKQSPVAGALLLLVWFFLKFIERREASHDKLVEAGRARQVNIEQARMDTLKDISTQCQQCQTKSSAVIERAISVMSRAEQREEQMLRVLEKLDRKLGDAKA